MNIIYIMAVASVSKGYELWRFNFTYMYMYFYEIFF